MTYDWNRAFEGFPAGSKQGLTMGEALRNLKAAFYERFIVQHTISEGATPTSLHDVGECGIVYVYGSGDTPISKYVEGALQYKDPAFYYDTGSALTKILSNEHTDYVGLTTDADHPQYVPLAGGMFSGDGLTLEMDQVTGLPLTGDEYDPFHASEYEDAVLGKAAHLADSGTYGRARHYFVITTATSKTTGALYFGYGKYDHTDQDETSDASGILELALPNRPYTMPIPDFGADFYEVSSPSGAMGLRLEGDAGAQFSVTYMESDS